MTHLSTKSYENLEHHSLEVLAYQWDGQEATATALALELQGVLPLLDAVLREPHFIMDTRFSTPVLTMSIFGVGDRRWGLTMQREEWLVLWLHRELLHDVMLMGAAQGRSLFRPGGPTIRAAEAPTIFPLTT